MLRQTLRTVTGGEDAATTARLAEAVNRFPLGSVHAISIGEPLPAKWNGVPLGSPTVVPSMARPDDVEWAAAHALYGALGLGWNGPLIPPEV